MLKVITCTLSIQVDTFRQAGKVTEEPLFTEKQMQKILRCRDCLNTIVTFGYFMTFIILVNRTQQFNPKPGRIWSKEV